MAGKTALQIRTDVLLDLKMTNRWCGPFPAHTRRETFPTDGEFSFQAAWSEEEKIITYTPQDLLEDIRKNGYRGCRQCVQ